MRNGNLARFLAERASEAGWYDQPAYYTPDVVTHGQMHDGSARLAEVLKSRGISVGDRVLLCLPDSPDLVQLLLACLARGAVAFLANPELHREDHAFVERDTEPALVVTTGSLLGRFKPSGVVDVAELMSESTRVDPGDYASVESDAHAYATYTSGTTGPPKAAIHRHADPFTFVDAMCRKALRLTPQDIGLSSARMYFAYGLGNSVWFPLATGGSAVINPMPVSAEVGATLCERFEPSVLYGVPTFFARVVDECSPDSFQSLRCLVSAGEALDVALGQRLMEFFGGIPILDGIGSTEVGQTFVSNSVDEWRLGTVGQVLPPYEIRVVTPAGTSVEPGVEGDLWVRGSSLAPVYWNWPLPLEEGGWLNTRDRVCIDGDGWVTYRCRADDTEIVGAVNVNPREVERLIVEHDAVTEAAVVGVREATGASALQAFLVPASGAFIDESIMRDIHLRLLNRLSAFKVPHRFAIVDSLPRTPNGKLIRHTLRAQSPTKPIWELPLRELESDAATPSAGQPASNRQNVGANAAGVTLNERLAALQQERHRLVVEAVSTEAAMMLGESDPRSVNRDLAFAELGFDSLMTVELCKRLGAATGLRLPETVGWDCGSISGLAHYVDTALSASASGVAPHSSALVGATGRSPLDEELTKLETMVVAIGASERQLVADRLRALLGAVTDGEDRLGERIQAASTPDEIFQLIDSEFGESSEA
ncbi:p-hydroxybenzoic acid--AMP ligase FadD22 [Mycobacterium decipiens]|uniref:p-hydroxybenzoic acid--AMP ligase FadD22 n=1 Tax=Mycobacterium decipiens TaxID=1430326 RepID=A0A1X2LU04_9MYCO|nr:p-hydroxybenzoic acid--AMP ligase FadD22 [Mycobacterium decipiens]OSC40423.1 p-hydroxybenzoic acid--AMP ligase FadD22 [Mycobacterium decipiens]